MTIDSTSTAIGRLDCFIGKRRSAWASEEMSSRFSSPYSTSKSTSSSRYGCCVDLPPRRPSRENEFRLLPKELFVLYESNEHEEEGDCFNDKGIGIDNKEQIGEFQIGESRHQQQKPSSTILEAQQLIEDSLKIFIERDGNRRHPLFESQDNSR